MESLAYPRPPIIEAAIEVRFADLVEPDIIAAASKAFNKTYPNVEVNKKRNINLHFGADGSLTSNAPGPEQTNYRHSNMNLGEILVVSPELFLTSQLPDYPGWDRFLARFRRDWTTWKQVSGYRKISQVGIRYINRIDLPADGPVVRQEDYLKVYAEIPEELGPTLSYAVQALLPLPALEAQVTINSGLVASPLYKHLSILLDMAVARAVVPPQRDDEMFALLDGFRLEKNRIFESCITDRARELFYK